MTTVKNYDIIAIEFVGCRIGNDTSSHHKLLAHPIIKGHVGSNSCVAFLFPKHQMITQDGGLKRSQPATLKLCLMSMRELQPRTGHKGLAARTGKREGDGRGGMVKSHVWV